MSIRLSEIQQQIVQHGDGPLLVVAGPGSGKTRVLTERIRRILNEGKGHFRILALTFTNKAANEMKERLTEIPEIDRRAFIGTFHSFCMEVLANRGKAVGIEKLPNIFESYQDRKQVLLKSIMDDPETKSVLVRSSEENDRGRLLDRWLEMIGSAKNNLLLPEMLEDDLDRKVYELYNNGLRASNVVDFDDLLLLTYRLFQERPIIADFYRRQYRYICVDEAQDLNEAQYRVLQALCGLEYRNVMMVGDPKQAIFVWNGADPKYLDLFEQDFGAKKISINENFRSSQVVVRAAKALAPEYEVDGQPSIMGSIKLIEAEDEKQEAALVIDYVQDLIESGHEDIEGPMTLDRCALLGRNRYVLAAAEDELRRLKLPYYKQLSTQHESESGVLKDFEVGLRILANPRDMIHLGILLRRWKIHEDSASLNGNLTDGLELLTHFKEIISENDHVVVIEALESIEVKEREFKFSKALDYLYKYAEMKECQDDAALIIEDIKTWRKHWDSYLRSHPGGQHSLISFLGQVALGTTQQPRQDGIALLTVHSAKGLEFDVVIIMGMVEGTFPDYRAKGSALLEEKRNAFVAVTRSKRLLGFSYPKRKLMPWGSVKKQKASRYLKDLGLIMGDK